MNDFLGFGNWFDKKYRTKLDGRWATMKVALNLALQRGNTQIVETGCVRMKDDFGAGYSTVLFCEFVEKHGGHLWSIDNNAHHLKICHELTKQYEKFRTLVHSDSVVALNAAAQLPGLNGKIGLLYLDSYDYPYGDMLNAYGGQHDIQNAMEIVDNKTEEQLLEEFGSIIDPCQQHCLNELHAALPHCDDKTVILIDDCSLPGGGKGRTAKLWLAANGYKCLLDHQQSLWSAA